TFVPADFTHDDIGQLLVAAGVDPSLPSLMLCEGVAVYLDLPVLSSLLCGLRAVAAPYSRLEAYS
ncbi:MAG: class I SAM-dependent methyltransferase, partial [Actinomycetes bacterium]